MSSESTVRVLPQPHCSPDNYFSISVNFFPDVAPHSLSATIHQVIWHSPGTLLRSADSLIASAQTHSHTGCMRKTVFAAGVRLQKHAPVAETVRSYGPFCGLSGDLVWWRMAGGEVEMARPSAMRVCMHGQALYRTSEFAGSLRAVNHLRAGAPWSDLDIKTTSLVHTISTTTSCSGLWRRNLRAVW